MVCFTSVLQLLCIGPECVGNGLLDHCFVAARALFLILIMHYSAACVPSTV